jgi:hypothetical protein
VYTEVKGNTLSVFECGCICPTNPNSLARCITLHYVCVESISVCTVNYEICNKFDGNCYVDEMLRLWRHLVLQQSEMFAIICPERF